MELLRDWDTLQDRLTVVRRGGTGHTINLYALRGQVERWCDAGRLRLLAGEGAVLLLREDGDFQRVYYAARDLPALTRALELLPSGTYVTDLVGQGGTLDQVADAHAAAGFAPRAFLRRMVRRRAVDPGAADGVEAADPGDAPEIDTFLRALLDRYVEQLPDLEELRSAAAAGGLLLVRDRGRIRGMLMYDLAGHAVHLRFWHVDADARGGGIGRRLMAAFLLRCADAKRIVLWVIGNNERSIAIYEHYGFERDGLLDRIMMLHKDQ